MSAHASKAPATFTIGALAATTVITLAALSAVLTVIAGRGACSDAGAETRPSGAAKRAVPANYLRLYRLAARGSGVPWTVLAAIGSIETDHGRSQAPGVRSGLNRHGCCAGPMQFNTRDGPPSTWARYRVDGNHDGTADIYAPEDAIPSAAAYLAQLARRAHGDLSQAILGYNHSPAYVREVLTRARAYARARDERLATTIGEPKGGFACGDLAIATAPANLRAAERVAAPRAYRALPTWAPAGPGEPGAIDARLYDDTVWILRRYRLRVNAAREAGHHTHGDGTAIDLVPADGGTQAAWDASAGALAHDVGWTAACARSGTRPACRLAPAIQFVGYDGYPSHGSPRTCTCPGPRRATAPAASRRPADGSWHSPSRPVDHRLAVGPASTSGPDGLP